IHKKRKTTVQKEKRRFSSFFSFKNGNKIKDIKKIYLAIYFFSSILLISLSIISASTEVKVLISKLVICDLISSSIGSSRLKNDNCMSVSFLEVSNDSAEWSFSNFLSSF